MKLLLVIAALGLLTGCGPSDTPQRRDEAVAMAQRYLDAVSGQAVDRGWSLLHPSAQDAWGSQGDFIAAAEAADWSDFEVAATEALRCDDGIWCPVALDVANGEESVPDFLLASPSGASNGIYFIDLGDIPGNAEMMVVLTDPFHWSGGVTPAGG